MAENSGSGVNTSVVVVLSGGMDSCVCAALAVRKYGSEAVGALHVSYGQRTEAREQRAFSEICDRLGIRTRLVVRNDALRSIGGSALTDGGIAVPEAGPEIGHQVPITYVPFRNAHFLSVAVSWAEVAGARRSILVRCSRIAPATLIAVPSITTLSMS